MLDFWVFFRSYSKQWQLFWSGCFGDYILILILNNKMLRIILSHCALACQVNAGQYNVYRYILKRAISAKTISFGFALLYLLPAN